MLQKQRALFGGLKNCNLRTFLVVQWKRILLPMQRTWLNSWSGKIPHAMEQLKSMCPQCSSQFITARTWKQPRCPSADEWIRKLWYIYTMKYYSAIKKNSFESVLMKWMKLEPIIQSEVSQKDKDHYSILTHIYGI